MPEIVGYGVCIRNTPIKVENTVVYQELTNIGINLDKISIDIVRADTTARPQLAELIKELGVGDQIHMYSIDAFLLGDCRRAILYYSDILKKGIDLVIYDFDGAIAKLSPFSTLRFGDRKAGEELLVKSLKSTDELIYDFGEYFVDATPSKNSGGLRTEARANISNAFKEIYFAYESYQIKQEKTLELLKDYCGIGSKVTFWLMAKDYEASLHYSDDLSNQPFEIFDLPKRCGKIPEEYHQITKLADSYIGTISSERERVEIAMRELNMISSYGVYRRWQLVAEKTPKPRKHIIIDFNFDDFDEKYTKK
ncbi:MAG: hypothetical protein IKY18_06775 [Oscillospiraceae bacterium]|nr:hypothetical protein [Oscillospiraceae bacterium]